MENLNYLPFNRVLGYARKMNKGDSLEVQIERLRKFGIRKDYIFYDMEYQENINRPNLLALLAELEINDHVVVTKMDVISEDILKTLQFVEDLKNDKKNSIQFLDENLNSFNKDDDKTFALLAKAAGQERDKKKKRLADGRARAYETGITRSGRPFGRPTKFTNHVRERMIEYLKLGLTMTEIAKIIGCDRSSVTKYIKKYDLLKTIPPK